MHLPSSRFEEQMLDKQKGLGKPCLMVQLKPSTHFHSIKSKKHNLPHEQIQRPSLTATLPNRVTTQAYIEMSAGRHKRYSFR